MSNDVPGPGTPGSGQPPESETSAGGWPAELVPPPAAAPDPEPPAPAAPPAPAPDLPPVPAAPAAPASPGTWGSTPSPGTWGTPDAAPSPAPVPQEPAPAPAWGAPVAPQSPSPAPAAPDQAPSPAWGATAAPAPAPAWGATAAPAPAPQAPAPAPQAPAPTGWGTTPAPAPAPFPVAPAPAPAAQPQTWGAATPPPADGWGAPPPGGQPPAQPGGAPGQWGAPPAQAGWSGGPGGPGAPGGAPGTWAPQPAKSGNGCLKACLVVAVILVVLGILAAIAISIFSAKLIEGIGVNPDGSIKTCDLITAQELQAQLGADAQALPMGGIVDATIGQLLDQRILKDKPDCWIVGSGDTTTAKQTGTTGRLALQDGGDTSGDYNRYRQAAQDGGYFAGDVSGYGDQAFCTAASEAGSFGILVRSGGKLAYVSLIDPTALAGSVQTGANGVLTSPETCAHAGEIAKAMLN